MARGPSSAQRINAELVENSLYTNNTLHANFTGTTNDAVLLFNAAGTYTGPTGNITDSNIVGPAANDGSFFSIFEPGVYAVELTVSQSGVASNVFGLSLNVANAGLSAVPALATFGMTHVVPVISLANQIASATITAVYRITQNLARAAGGAIVRGHATEPDGTPPILLTAGIFNSIRIGKVMDLAY